MKMILSSRIRHYVARVSIFLITVALIAGMIGCGGGGGDGGDGGNGEYYNLTIDSTVGGNVTTPGEETFHYDEGTVVNLVAEAEEGYQFMKWTGSIGATADVYAAETTITVNYHCSITANFVKGIRDWYDLDAIRDNLGGHYVLMNDLDSTTAGYSELASSTTNGGKGWQPIGSLLADPTNQDIVDPVDPFTGSLDGQGYEIRDLFINRPDEDGVGLFGCVSGGVIENLGVVNTEVTGRLYVGGLVGENHYGTVSNSYYNGSVTGKGEWIVGGLVGGSWGTVSDSYSTGSVTGDDNVGGLVGYNAWEGAVSNSYSTDSVTGNSTVGGLVGGNGGAVSNSYSTGSVIGGDHSVGGLAGGNWRTVSNSYSTGSVTGAWNVGGLVGWNHHGTVSNSYYTGSVTGGNVGGLVGENHEGTVSNSYYSYDDVLINGRHVITIGALFNGDFDQWLANDKFLDVDERLSQEDGYYLINDVNDFKSLLAFGQGGALKFRLKNELDLSDEPNFYIPYLAGEFDGNGRKIANLSFSFDFVSQVGLFGYLASGGAVTGVGAENVNITGQGIVGGLVGENEGTVSNSYSTGRVAGYWSVGGLVGCIGWNGGTVSNSYYNYNEFLVNGIHFITIGALFNQDFDQWLANDKFLYVNERLSQEDGYYVINDVSDFKQILAFGQNASLKFRLENDLDLAIEPNFYIPYLAGEFDGNGHKISNLTLNFNFVAQVGLFGYLASSGKVSEVSTENVNVTVTGNRQVGGLAGGSAGTVSNSYSSGSVTGDGDVGGLVGWNKGTVSDSYSSGNVTGDGSVGGLVGWNYDSEATVNNSYSIGEVTGDGNVGGLIGSHGGTVSNSFWDIETSGQATPDGGIGKTTAEMKSIATFTGAAWDITAVASGVTDPTHIWNIVDGETYPFLSWQPVS